MEGIEVIAQDADFTYDREGESLPFAAIVQLQLG